MSVTGNVCVSATGRGSVRECEDDREREFEGDRECKCDSDCEGEGNSSGWRARGKTPRTIQK